MRNDEDLNQFSDGRGYRVSEYLGGNGKPLVRFGGGREKDDSRTIP